MTLIPTVAPSSGGHAPIVFSSTASDPNNNKSILSSTLSRTSRREGKRLLIDFFERHIYPQVEIVAIYPPFSYLLVVERDVFLVLKSFHTIGGDCIKEKQIDWARAQLIELSREIDLPHCRLHLVIYGSVFEGTASSSLSSPVATTPAIHLLKHRRRIEDRLLSPFRFHSIIYRDHTFLWDSSALTPKLGIEIRRLGVPSGAPLWISWVVPQSPMLISDSPKKPDATGWEQTCVQPPNQFLLIHEREDPADQHVVEEDHEILNNAIRSVDNPDGFLAHVFEPSELPFELPSSPKPPVPLHLIASSSPAAASAIVSDSGAQSEVVSSLSSSKLRVSSSSSSSSSSPPPPLPPLSPAIELIPVEKFDQMLVALENRAPTSAESARLLRALAALLDRIRSLLLLVPEPAQFPRVHLDLSRFASLISQYRAQIQAAAIDSKTCQELADAVLALKAHQSALDTTTQSPPFPPASPPPEPAPAPPSVHTLPVDSRRSPPSLPSMPPPNLEILFSPPSSPQHSPRSSPSPPISRGISQNGHRSRCPSIPAPSPPE